MSRKQFAVILFTVAVCSLLGGAVMSRVLAPRPASAIIDIPTKIPDVIKAHKLIIIDDNNRTRGFFDKNGLSVLDAKGKTRAFVGETGLKLRDANGKTRALVGENGLEVLDAKGKAKVKSKVRIRAH